MSEVHLSWTVSDEKLLAALSSDARLTVAELARRVGLSKTPVQARSNGWRPVGSFADIRAMLDPVKLRLDHVAFVEVKLSDTREKALAAFNAPSRKWRRSRNVT